MSKRIFVIVDHLWRVLVLRPVLAYQQWRCYKAHTYLLRHDRDYRQQYISHQVAKERQQLYQNGVLPTDPLVPDQDSVAEKLPPMAWPYRQ